MADDAPAATDQPAVSTPYLVRQDDGSTTTFVLHTSRQPTIGEVANYAQSQGHSFAGFPEGPAAPSPPPAEAPSPVLSNAPPEPEPTLAGRAYNTLVAPRRTLVSQLPSMSAAAAAGTYGAAVGAPFFPPFGSIVGGLTAAGLAGAGAEAAQYGAEQVIGSEPAEPGTFGQRVAGAGLRSAAGELVPSTLRGVGERVERAVLTPARAAAELQPVLTGPRVVAPEGAGAARQLAAEAANTLPDWWAENVAGKTPDEILQAWAKKTPEEQAAMGPAVQTYIGTIAQGAKPWGSDIGRIGQGGIYGAGLSYLYGHPQAILPSLVPAAYDIAGQAVPKALSFGLRSPRIVPLLAGMPRVADVAGPMIMAPVRAGSQVYVAEQGPRSATLFP